MKIAAWLLASSMAISTFAASAWAQQPTKQGAPRPARESDLCGNADPAVSAMARAAACTRLIDSGKWSGKEAAGLYANRCIAYDRLGKTKEAFDDCVEALKLDPDDVPALQMRASIEQNKGETDQALADYDKAVALGAKNSALFVDRGNILLSRGEADKAIADYDQAIELDARSLSARLDRGSAWLGKGDADRALADFDKAVELAPSNPSAWSDRGAAWLIKGDKARAAEDFRQALKLNPANAYAGLWLFIARGGGDAKADAKSDAKADLKAQSAKFSPGAWPWPVVRFYLGDAKAEDMLAAAKAPGEQCEAHFYLGAERLLDKAGDEAKNEAWPHLRQAAETCPKDFTEYFVAVSEVKKLEPAAPKADAAPKTDTGSDPAAKPRQ